MRSVDERVVEMRFDNKEFESGVRESMSTLNRFESSLDGLGSTRGIDGINRAISNISFSPLQNGLAAAGRSFSALETIAVGALMRIGGKITDYLANQLNQLTVAPVKQGFDEYELKMGAVQTMMASTGEDLSVINGYLEQLNAYADKTIYSFSDMTQNIGKFTNNGVKLEDAVSAIQGISNAAAVAGANSNEASRAMYNFSQALSQGSVKLIDWKSIQNANMATVDFKQNLIDTAVAMGTLVKEGDQYQSTTTDLQGNVSELFDANKMFNESLSSSWMTTEVLVQTLQNYSNDVRDMTEAEKAEYEAKLKSIGYTDEQIKSIEELGSKAFDAAQDVKTFSQLMDTLKEAVGSGWSQTFELIFGDFEEAKKLWTGVNNFISPIIDTISDTRNNMLKEWRGTGGRDDLIAGIVAGFNNVKDIFLSIKGVWDEVFPKEKFLMLKEAIEGPNGFTTAVGKGAKILTDFSRTIKAFGEGLKPSDDTLEKIKDTFRGFFSLLNIGKKIITSVFNAFKPAGSTLKNLGGDILSITASVGKFLTKLDEGFTVEGAFGEITKRLTGVVSEFSWFLEDIFDFKEEIADWGTDIGGIFAMVFNHLILMPIETAVRVIGRLLGKEGEELYRFSDMFIKPLQTIRDAVNNFLEGMSSFKFKMPDFSPLTNFVDKTAKRLNPLKTAFELLKAFFTGLVKFLEPVGEVLAKVGKKVGDALFGLINKILDLMTAGDFNGLFDLVNSGVLTLLGVQMLKFSGSVNEAAAAFNGNGSFGFIDILQGLKDPKKLLGGVGEGLKELLGGILPFQEEAKPDGFKQIAESIAILAASLFVLALIDSEKLGEAILALTSLFAELVGTMKLMTGMELAVSGVVKLAIAVLILAAALKSIAKLDSEQLAVGVSGMLGVILEMAAAFKLFSTMDVEGSAGAMLVFSFAMVVMGGALKILGSLDWMSLGRALAAFAGSMGLTILTFKLIKGDDLIKVAGSIFILSEAMMRMSIALKIMSTMDWKGMGIALISFAGTMATIVIAFKMIRLYDLIPVAGAIFILSEAMMRMGVALKILSTLGWQGMGVALISFAGTMGVMVAAFKLLKNDDILKISAAILVLSFALTQMAIGLKIMGSLRLDQMIIAIVSFASVMGIFVGMVELMDSSAGKMAAVAASLIVLSIGLTTLAVAMKLLGLLSVGDIIKSLVVLAGTLAILGGAAALLSPIIPMMALLGAAFAAAGAGLLLFGMGLASLAAGITATVALLDVGVEAILLALEILIVGTLNAIAKSVDAIVGVFKAIVNAIIIVIRDSVPELVEVTLFAVASIVESLLKYLPTAVEGLLVVLDQLMQSLSVHVPILVGYLVDLIINVINTLAEKIPFFVNAVVNLIKTFIDAVINALNGLDMENLRNGIIAFGLVSLFMGSLAGAAMLAPAAMAGVLAVGAVIAEMALVLAAIGALNKIPGLAEFAESGGDLLRIVGEGIGQFLGGIVGGIAEGVMSTLPQMGEYLSQFMENVQPFIDGAKDIDPSTMEGVASLVKVMMLLTAADLLDQLVGWVSGDTGSALADFGDELIEFAPKLVEFSEKVKDINAEQVQGAADATLALAEMASKIPNSGGLVGAITGENSLKDFGSELAMYAPNLVRFARFINESGTDISGESMRGVSEATIALAEMASKIPNSGGLLAMITGENSLSAFGSELALYGPHLVDFADTVKDVTANQLKGATDATVALVDMASKIPNVGGLVALFTGDNSLASFGAELADYGYYLNQFSNNVKDVNVDLVKGAAEATAALVESADKVPNTGGLAAWFAGDNGLASFGKELVTFGDHLSKYSDKVQGISLTMVQGSIDATTKLIEMGAGVDGVGGIGSLISGNNSIAEFGKELKEYAPNLVEFAKTVSEAGVTSDKVKGAAEATETLGKMTENLPKTDGWVNSVIGKNSLASFGEELGAYGQPLADFAGAVNGKVDDEMVKGAAEATIRLAGMAKDIPATDGLVQKITGKNSLASFGEELAAYGPNLNSFAGDVEGISKDDVIGAADATAALTTMAQGIPFEGGLVERITGKNSLSTFGEELKDYGRSLSKFADRVEGVSLEQVQGAVDATKVVCDMAAGIPYESISKLVGGKTSLSMFGEELKDFARPFAKFADSAAGVEPGIDVKAREIATATTELMNGLPVISAKIDFEALGDQLKSFGRDFGKFYDKIADVDASKFTGIVTGLNSLANISKDISNINGKGLVQLASGIGDISTEGVSTFVSSFANSAGDVRDSAAGMVSGAVSGINSQSSSLFGAVAAIGNGVVNAFKQSLPYAMFRAIVESQVMKGILDGLNGTKRNELQHSIGTICTTIMNLFSTNLNPRNFYNIGLNIPKGLNDGMLAGLPQLQGTASKMGSIVSEAIRNRLKIQSPSKDTYEVGEYTILGAINGMEAYADQLKTTTEGIVDEDMLAPMKEAIRSINDDGTVNTENQPVIRPVLDLTEIQNGYKELNSLFDDQYRVDMQARMGKMETASSINPEQIDKLEDAIRSISNDDVISEMETLRGDISNLQDAISHMQVVMNTGALVGEILEPIDAALGAKALVNSRGRY